MRHLAVFSCAAVGATFLAACGAATTTPAAPNTSSSSTTVPAPASTSSSVTATAPPAPASSSSATSAASPAPAAGPTVTVASSSLGMILVDARGRTLYLFERDTAGMSSCTGQCATYWPPLVGSQPQAGGGVNASKLSTVTRPDGSSEIAYNGHPLYYFSGDTNPGQTRGEGINAFGANWYVLGPSGNRM